MKLALFGYGAMNQFVGARASEEGHEVALVITSRDAAKNRNEIVESLRGIDAAIDFSIADAVLSNVVACVRAGVPLVVGTTGWSASESEVRRVVGEHDGALIYGANFSVGVNLFYRIVERAAAVFDAVDGYDPFIEEAHHARKRDAPSGTALRLRELFGATAAASSTAKEIPITSTRAGFIPGTHRVGFDSVHDQIMLTHTARTREGFATGALQAAHWIIGRRGVYEFSEMLDEILAKGTKRK